LIRGGTVSAKIVVRDCERSFRRNGYKTSLFVPDHEQYVAICNWCEENFGERFGARYHWFEDTGEWQLYTRSDFAHFMMTWGGYTKQKE
jgi:hypothetical protein